MMRPSAFSLPLSLPLLLLLVTSRAEPSEPASQPKAARSEVRTYTNEDLDRVAPFRGQTGALSEPAVSSDERTVPARSSASDDSTQRARDEAYWRREADRVREKVRTLDDQAADLRSRIDALATGATRFSSRSGRSSGSNSSETLERRLERLDGSKAQLSRRISPTGRGGRTPCPAGSGEGRPAVVVRSPVMIQIPVDLGERAYDVTVGRGSPRYPRPSPSGLRGPSPRARRQPPRPRVSTVEGARQALSSLGPVRSRPHGRRGAGQDTGDPRVTPRRLPRRRASGATVSSSLSAEVSSGT